MPAHLKPHDYTSTACLHDLHQSCRRNCKFCDSHCQCKCHLVTTAQCPICFTRFPFFQTVLPDPLVAHSNEQNRDKPARTIRYMTFFLPMGNNIDFVRCSACGEPVSLKDAQNAKACPYCKTEREDRITFFNRMVWE
jgi:hypothetical protein